MMKIIMSKIWTLVVLVCCSKVLISLTLADDKHNCGPRLSLTENAAKIYKSIFDEIPVCSRTLDAMSKEITEESFDKYLNHFKKYYEKGSDKYKARFKVFRDNLRNIITSQLDYVAGRSNFSLGVNQFSDMVSQQGRLGQ